MGGRAKDHDAGEFVLEEEREKKFVAICDGSAFVVEDGAREGYECFCAGVCGLFEVGGVVELAFDDCDARVGGD